jgi:hypothetical protein
MLPSAPYSAAGQRRGISACENSPSPAREASAGPCRAPQVVLLYSDKRVSTRSSLAALADSLRSRGARSRTSTFLHPFAPRALLRFDATMDALTSAEHGSTDKAEGQCLPLCQPLRAAWQMGIRPGVSAVAPQPHTPADLPASFVAPSDHSVSNHPLPSRCDVWRFATTGLTVGHVASTCRVLADHASWVSPLASRLTTAIGRIEFANATDWSFASGCSPPRLTATQLPSATRGQTLLDEDFHLADATTLQAH